MNGFQDKVSIITGGTSGIGRALGVALAQKGALVILAGRRIALAKEIAQNLQAHGYRAEAAGLDVTQAEAVRELVQQIFNRYGRLDYMFNNAGISVAGEARDFTLDHWRDVLNVNLFGTINGVTASYPIMVKQGFGHIINTASIEGLIPLPGSASYVTSKYGVVGLSNALRIEGADLGVNVSVVCPGYIKTDIFHKMKTVGIDRRKILQSLPNRLGMSAEKCSKKILRGVERNKAIIVITGHAKILWMLHRINPGLIFWINKHYVKRYRNKQRIEENRVKTSTIA
jgi:NAD(P)-dependent dehydrogenase (short-subunit alcohol dehydrogenase family)